ncbi:MAG: hypothetical protein V2J89_14205 [Halieaceae bacterium]|jgi:hypothetical protein|nr:hypothetical protein [Halieaceae bacterium]
MDYSDLKAFQVLLFFGAALGFGVWQVVSVRRDIRKDKERDD